MHFHWGRQARKQESPDTSLTGWVTWASPRAWLSFSVQWGTRAPRLQGWQEESVRGLSEAVSTMPVWHGTQALRASGELRVLGRMALGSLQSLWGTLLSCDGQKGK